MECCVLLHKGGRAGPSLHVDFVGCDAPDRFVVGCGLDFDGRMRELADMMALEYGREEQQ